MDNYNRVPDDHTGLADLCRGTVTADTAIVYTETALGRLGHPIERLRTIQRIQDLAALFKAPRHINPDFDFSLLTSLRHINSWDGANAYRAVAIWMRSSGIQRYCHYLRETSNIIEIAAGPEATPKLLHDLRQLVALQQQIFEQSSSGVTTLAQRPEIANATSVELPEQQPGIDYSAQARHHMSQVGNDWQGLITDYKQYKSYRDAYNSLKNQARSPVEDIEKDDSRFLPYVQRLYHAVLDMSEVIENPRLKPQRKRRHGEVEDEGDEEREFVDCVAVARVKELKAFEIELICWEIVEEAWYHQQGQHNIPPWYNPPKEKKVVRYANFEDRIVKCEEALKSSKSIVKQLLGVGYAKRLAYDPDAERKVDNKKLNMKRDQENKAGKYAQAAGLVVIDEADRSITASTGEQVSVPHPVTNRMAQELASRNSGSRDTHGPEGPVPFNGVSEYRGPGYDY